MDSLARGLFLWFLMAAGITQPGGAGTIIYIYDDSDTSGGRASGPYTFAQIATAFPADFTDLGTNKPSYRAKVDLQIGDTGVGTATTTLSDTVGSSVVWDSGKTLKSRPANPSPWVITFGTKVGTGAQASGVKGTHLTFGAVTTPTASNSLYGSVFFQTSGAMSFGVAIDGTSEAINCLFQSVATGTAPINLGSVTNKFGTIYNCDISHTTSVAVQTNFFGTNVERITIAAASPTTFVGSNAAGFSTKDLAMFGSPTQSDLRWAGINAVGWRIYRPAWTSNAPKFSTSTAGTPPLNAFEDQTIEFWKYDVKVVNGITGDAVSGIPIKLTDNFGNVVVNAVTGSDGRVNFGSGLTVNMVPVMDHYAVGTTYTQRHRSPFLTEVNTGINANPNWASMRYYANWPGYDEVTTSSGSFEDLGDLIPLLFAGSGPTTWVELTVP